MKKQNKKKKQKLFTFSLEGSGLVWEYAEVCAALGKMPYDLQNAARSCAGVFVLHKKDFCVKQKLQHRFSSFFFWWMDCPWANQQTPIISQRRCLEFDPAFWPPSGESLVNIIFLLLGDQFQKKEKANRSSLGFSLLHGGQNTGSAEELRSNSR